jgi:hypothetical protein
MRRCLVLVVDSYSLGRSQGPVKSKSNKPITTKHNEHVDEVMANGHYVHL